MHALPFRARRLYGGRGSAYGGGGQTGSARFGGPSGPAVFAGPHAGLTGPGGPGALRSYSKLLLLLCHTPAKIAGFYT